ncbi:MAG: pyruvate dehydrogenase complex dihydrolipoamide acetyltransferase [Aaplasma endosymbiont of Hyalomma asiaticum]
MPVKILMPALSPTMRSGTVTHWHKKEGDSIKPGDIIADIETDKAVIEFEYADEPGVLYKITKTNGSKDVPVNQVIALVKVEDDDEASLVEMISAITEGEGADQSVTNTIEPQNSAQGRRSPVPNTQTQALDFANTSGPSGSLPRGAGRINASPVAKKLAAQLSLDISKIVGTGPYGRVVKADVVKASSTCNSAAQVEENAVSVEVSAMRRVVSERLVEVKRNVPHFYLAVDCMVSELLQVRARINSGTDVSTKITVNDFIIKATALALREHPEVNASWNGDSILHYKSVDVAFAVSIDGGLLTPIIPQTDKLSISEISKTVKSLATRAKERKLLPHEFQGGGITISNLGMFGIKEFYAIINPPQSCIIAVGQSEKRAVVIDDSVVVADVMSVTLSVDHRVIDGALAAKFLNKLKFYIENPLLALAQ